MNIDEMEGREPYGAILVETLARGWGEQFGRRHSVGFSEQPGSQRWILQRTLGGYCVPRVQPVVRRALADGFRFTRRKRRLVAQWMLGTGLATTCGLRVFSGVGFFVSPPVEDAEWKLVVPGNQRVRVHDFRNWSTRVFAKSRFSRAGLRREIELRGSHDGPFLNLSDWSKDASWFEEPLIDGWALPRCPPWIDAARAAATVFSALRGWQHAGGTTRIAAARYATQLADSICSAASESDESMRAWVRRLVEVGSAARCCQIGLTHGDLQPGNVLVCRSGDVFAIDWEHWGERTTDYDAMVWQFGARQGGGLARRIAASMRNRAWSRAAVAIFLLEDLLWFLREASSGPIRGVTRGLAARVGELGDLAGVLG